MALPQGGVHDVTLSCDVTTTVADVARSLAKRGLGSDPELAEIARQGCAPVTLRVARGPGRTALLLDPMAPIAASGLQSGHVVQPVREFGAPGIGEGSIERVCEVAGLVEVIDGEQHGALFSLVRGDNSIGRDRANRVRLLDRSVSRHHAMVHVGEDGGCRIHDLGSANGSWCGDRAADALRLDRPTQLRLGEVTIRITPGPRRDTDRSGRSHAHRVMHTRSPRLAPHFAASVRTLPAPPEQGAPARMPLLALLAPMAMGGAMYAMTQSPMSLLMMAFTPMMMVGSWVDGKLGGRRRRKKEVRRFAAELEAERTQLHELREAEVQVRATETPTMDEIRDAIEQRSELLWTRRPEHRAFLEVRFGEGALPSRTRVELPERGESSTEQWESLQRVAAEFGDVCPVPVIERFDRCGSIGIAGDPYWAEGVAAAIAVQLVGLHSPHELLLACFAGQEHEANWSWLKWLPHVAPVASPIPSWPLAEDAPSALRLLSALEGVMEARRSGRSGPGSGLGARTHGAHGGIRSHLDADTRNDEAQGEAVNQLPTIPAIIVVVLDDGLIDSLVDTARLIALAETGPDYGMHFIWLALHRQLLPAACRTFIEVDRNESRVHFVRMATAVPLIRHEHIDSTLAHHLARCLAPVEDTASRMLDESDLPKSVALQELHEVDLLSGGSPIALAWARNGSLTSSWSAGEERAPVSLATTIGHGPDGRAMVDLRVHGPHALVGGTTGSGKSEFLQSWIMSLAAQLSPERLTFLLVDYKGGAAFAECVDLPHTVGLVTDLSPHLVRRALISLRAELRHREELLAAYGAKDLISMERCSNAKAPPVLVVVIDEFAALAKEMPDFVEGVIDIAQRGRSLGLHVILATQRPAGVVTANLRANTNLRVALRMADEADSLDVIGVSDAAFFAPGTPGRGAIKVGPGHIAHFQAGYLGGRTTTERPSPEFEFRSLKFSESEPWDAGVDRLPAQRGGSRARDIERLSAGIVAAAAELKITEPRRPWLDELPAMLPLAELMTLARPDEAPSSVVLGADDGALFALCDDPAAQAQLPVRLDFEENGHLAIFGAGGTGKTSALVSIAASTAMGHDTDLTHVYAIDAAGGALDVISQLPTVGAVAQLADTELVGRVLRHLHAEVVERGTRFAAVRAGELGAYRAHCETVMSSLAGEVGEAAVPAVRVPEPRLILLLDGFAAFRQATETMPGTDSPFALLREIMLQGRAVGVHVALTADRPAAVPAALSAALQQQFVLRLTSPHDYTTAGVPADALEHAPPGRAILVGDGREVQIAITSAGSAVTGSGARTRARSARAAEGSGSVGADLASQAAGIEALAAELRKASVPPAHRITNAPTCIPLDELSVSADLRPVVGIDVRDFSPVTVPLRGLGVIAGPSGSGQSTAALCCVSACERLADARGQRIDTVLLSFAENGLQPRRAWGRVAVGNDEVERLAAELVTALGGRAASAGLPLGEIGRAGATMIAANPPLGLSSSPHATPTSFPAEGACGIIVIERPAEAEGTAALAQLVALAKAARRAEVLVLFEFESGTGSGVWDLYQALKQPKWGVVLQPDQHETQHPFREDLGRVRRSDFPPGRGFMIEQGCVTPVQIATPADMTSVGTHFADTNCAGRLPNKLPDASATRSPAWSPVDASRTLG